MSSSSKTNFAEAVARVAKFAGERGKMNGLDPDEIASLHTGDDVREACLRLSDVKLLLKELGRLQDASSTASDAYRKRFESAAGGLFGPIDNEMLELEKAAKRAAH